MRELIISLILQFCMIFDVTTKDLCNLQDNQQCSAQLWGPQKYPAGCKTYTEIKSDKCQLISYELADKDVNLGKVKIKLHVDEELEQLSYKVTFSDILWTNLKVGLSHSEYDNVDECMVFKIWDNLTISQDSALNLNCVWPDVDYEKVVFHCEAALKSEISAQKFIIYEPTFERIRKGTPIYNLEIFSYMDITDTQVLQLRIQMASPEYNVTDYKVEVFRERKNISQLRDLRILSASDAADGELTFDYPTFNEYGSYFFAVSPISDVCEEDRAQRTFTPKVYISRRSNSLVIGIVGASVIIPVLLFIMFMWNKMCKLSGSHATKLLIIYTPSTMKSHDQAVICLVRMLKDLFHINVMSDIVNIPNATRKDLMFWSSRSFKKATHVAYVTSPGSKNFTREVDAAMLRYIKGETANLSSKKQIFIVTLPSSASNIPDELANLKTFNLLKDFDMFIDFVAKSSFFYIASYSKHQLYLNFVAAVLEAQQKQCDFITPEIRVTRDSSDETFEDTDLLMGWVEHNV